MFTVQVKGDAELRAKFDALPADVKTVLSVKVKDLAIALQTHVIRDKLHGQVLKQRSGALARSIQYNAPVTEGDVIWGKVFSAGDVKYAAIHEYGGTIKHPGGTPYLIMGGSFKSAKQAAIFGAASGSLVFISKANAEGENLPVTKPHDIPIPGRSFLRSSLTDMKTQIVDELRQAAVQGAQEALHR